MLAATKCGEERTHLDRLYNLAVQVIFDLYSFVSYVNLSLCYVQVFSL